MTVDSFIALCVMSICTVVVSLEDIQPGYWQGLTIGLCIGVIATNVVSGWER